MGTPTLNGRIKKLTAPQARRLLNRQARRYLNISGAEFVRRWKAGEFQNQDRPEIMRVAMLLPLGR